LIEGTKYWRQIVEWGIEEGYYLLEKLGGRGADGYYSQSVGDG